MKLHTLVPDYSGQPLRELLSLPLPCGGRQHCGNCGICLRGEASPATPEESAFLRKYTTPPPEGFSWRLACFCALHGPADVLLPEQSSAVHAEAQGALPAYDGSTPGWGLAVDIGTTTIAMAAYHFPEQEPVAVCSEMNRQSAFGADVLSRIGGDCQALHACLQAQLRDMLAQLGIPPQDITRAVITGNTAMLHFFAGLDPSGMGRSPFTPQSLFGAAFPWELLPHAEVWLPPCITAFVGADITCGALAAGFTQGEEALLLADVGTNGEMLLRSGGQLRCCSVAAGPAFEGAEISCGMPALPGAVDSVRAKAGTLHWHAIPGAAVQGICGTGLVSALRAFLELGTLEPSGAICSDESNEFRIQQESGAAALWLHDTKLTITQQDVRKLQLVKASIAAGIQTLLAQADTRAQQIDRLWLAGGFGSYLQPEDAAAIGMIPQALAARAAAGGNLALHGAAMLLFSQSLRGDILRLASETTEIPLATNAFFQEAFVDEMEF